MRRNYYQLISEINNLFGKYDKTLYNVNLIAKKTNTTWRTARNILFLLKSLGVINLLKIKKRDYFHSNLSQSSEDYDCYYCGNDGTVLIPICKGCLDSFNKYIEEFCEIHDKEEK